MSDFLAQRDEKPADFLLPETVKNWFTHMYTHMLSGNILEMSRLYEKEFSVLTNNYFKQSPWPERNSIEHLVENDSTFLVLYEQIYFRHVFSKLPQAKMQQTIASWTNYQMLFDGLLNDSFELEILPSQWLFDIVGEFLYQFQSFCQFRTKMQAKRHSASSESKEKKQDGAAEDSEDMTLFQKHSRDIWTTSKVLNYLHAIVKKSKIVEYLQGTIEKERNEDGSSAASEMLGELGYFSLICLSRAYVLFGDYYTSLKLLEPIEIYQQQQQQLSGNKKNARHMALPLATGTELYHEKSPSCQISMLFHMGFAQFMLRDFVGAVRSLSNLILQIYRNRSSYTRLSDYEQMLKLNEKSLALLVILLFLCPGQRVHDHIHATLREKYQEKQTKVQKSQDLSIFCELFSSACPKFICFSSALTSTCTSNAPAMSSSTSTTVATTPAAVSPYKHQEATQLQLKRFLETIVSQKHLPVLRSYVKLYRSIELLKLATFRKTEETENEETHAQAEAEAGKDDTHDQVEQIRAELMSYKLYGKSLKTDVHFYLANDLVLVDEQVNNQRTGEYFMNHIHKFGKIIQEKQRIP